MAVSASEEGIREAFALLHSHILSLFQATNTDSMTQTEILASLGAILEGLERRQTGNELTSGWDMLDGRTASVDDSDYSLVTMFQYEYVDSHDTLLNRGIPMCPNCGQPPLHPLLFTISNDNDDGKDDGPAQEESLLLCHECLAFECNNNPQIMAACTQPLQEVVDALDALQVRCPFSRYGCEVICERKHIADHHTSCEYTRYPCLNCDIGCEYESNDRDECKRHIVQCSSKKLRDIAEAKAVQRRKIFSSFVMMERDDDNDRCRRCGVDPVHVAACQYHPGTWQSLTFLKVCQLRARGAFRHGQAVMSTVVPSSIMGAVALPLLLPVSVPIIAAIWLFPSANGQGRKGANDGPLDWIGEWLTGTLAVSAVWLLALLPMVSVVAPAALSLAGVGAVAGAVAGLRESSDEGRWTCCGRWGSFASPCRDGGGEHVVDPVKLVDTDR
eukprot:TRINITY_DN3182_c0_g1_i3.p1 TRINITY_DN3182_c0_g1~~TRINITY_DN3182_c0_g1_i3.p1  ORF type:complete len:517 (+),score=57.26 TRINITY_DN3182_c0_g1_i3:222-1553(+)